MNRFALLALVSINVWATEPGYLVNEKPPAPPKVAQAKPPPQKPSAKPFEPAPKDSKVSLDTEFKRARGLNAAEAQLLDYQRISCDRRIYTQDGETLDGDADLKVTRVNYDLVEAEFPARIYLAVHNPWQNGLMEIESASPRKLINLRDWQDGQSLKIDKRVSLVPADRSAAPRIARAETEFRIVRDTYPPQFIVRESIAGTPQLTLFYFCI